MYTCTCLFSQASSAAAASPPWPRPTVIYYYHYYFLLSLVVSSFYYYLLFIGQLLPGDPEEHGDAARGDLREGPAAAII